MRKKLAKLQIVGQPNQKKRKPKPNEKPPRHGDPGIDPCFAKISGVNSYLALFANGGFP